MTAKPLRGFVAQYLVAAFSLCSLGKSAFCIDPAQPLHQMYHLSWTAKDGLRGMVISLAQTSDGFLWVGTSQGLFRFDGLTFEQYKPEVGSFRQRTYFLFVQPRMDYGLATGEEESVS